MNITQIAVSISAVVLLQRFLICNYPENVGNMIGSSNNSLLSSNILNYDDGKNLVPDNIIRMKESGKKAIKRSYKGNFIEIGDDKGSFIIINEGESIAIEAKESYIYSGFKVDDVYFIRSRREFKYKPFKYILAVQDNKIKLFYSGHNGVLKDVSHYAEQKFKNFNLYFEGFDRDAIHIISIRGINKFQLRNLKEVNTVLMYIKLKN
ncbi:hypothetical protein [Oceanirhabdus sp. W0125-5]|uniref:hypothetical protein n=1 Tax=Oceanirhabdus sp. W0125-5 TaxID=2999116 RepID=UPI0022F2BD88|nr:hypothetical protein [Oceanirhabdus sp. W0125-5]WBW99520.1 hypothetical protein OW730_12470 [Oceanirhabdus sp. W0125-5]